MIRHFKVALCGRIEGVTEIFTEEKIIDVHDADFTAMFNEIIELLNNSFGKEYDSFVIERIEEVCV